MTAMRVLQIVTTMNRGGLETMLMNYLRQIDREQVRFDFLVHRAEGSDYDAEIRSLGGRIYRLPQLNPFSPGYRRELNAFFREPAGEYRVVHSHLDCMSAIPLKAAEKAGIPVRIAHAHSSSQDRDIRFPLKLMFKKRIPSASTHMFACSRAAGEWMFGGARFEVLPNAIDTGRFAFSEETRQKTRASLGIGDRLAAGHVGRFYYPKNHAFLLKVFREVLKINKDSVLILAGDGPLRPEIEKAAEDYGIKDRVIFLGLREDIPDLLSAMDVFVFPSHYEWLPVTLIEAQTSGLPCLISDKVPAEAALTDYVTSMSLDAPPERWAEKALELASRPRHADIGSIRAAGYDIEESARMLQSFYLRAAGGEEDAKLWQR